MMTLTQKVIVKETTAVFQRNRRPGEWQCLACDKRFRSWHIIKNRICAACIRQWERNMLEEK